MRGTSSTDSAMFLWLLFALSFAVDELRISRPTELAKLFPDGISTNRADFGTRVEQTLSIVRSIVHAPSNDADGCREIEPPKNWPSKEDGFILMVERGSCTFVTKTLDAQSAGASAVIVVNSDDGDLPLMIDDGMGAYVNIPAVIISKSDGATLKKTLDSGKAILGSLNWGALHTSTNVKVDFWTQSVDTDSAEIKRDFGAVVASLGRRLSITPHFRFYNGTLFECDSGNDCADECTNGGRYCDPDPDTKFYSKTSGEQLVQENLRQMCVYNVTQDMKKPELWWTYATLFEDNCRRKTQVTESCSLKQAKRTGVSGKRVMACVKTSGGYSVKDGKNTAIDAEMRNQKNAAVLGTPVLFINGVRYGGKVTCPTPVHPSSCGILATICSQYVLSDIPDACRGSVGCPLGQSRDACNRCLPLNSAKRSTNPHKCASAGGSGGVSTGKVVGIVILFTLLAGMALYYFYYRSQSALRKELADIMQQYAPLDSPHDAMHHVPHAVDSAY